jgi:DNA-binding NarL/FixJ family response regulator
MKKNQQNTDNTGVGDFITISISIDEKLKTEFETFFKIRQMTFSNGLQFVMKDYLVNHRIKNLEKMMNQYCLSPREKEVAVLACKGLRIKEIAKSLYVSKDTINTHMKNIYRKCKVTNAVQLVNLLSQNRV